MDGRSVTAAEISSFQREGFVRIAGLLPRDEVKRFGAAVDQAVDERTRHDRRRLEERSRYEQSFRQCLNLWEDQPAVRPLSFHPQIGRAAAALLGAEAVRIWHDQALYQESGGRETDPHQDQPYWSIAEPRTITAWIPFQPVRRANGAVGFLPGSHRMGLRKFANIFTARGLDLEAIPETRNQRFDYVEADGGDVVFHHGLTIHRAYPNPSEDTRRVHTVIYFADGCTRNAFRHPSVDRPGIPLGAKIESDLTPIAWPRPEGDLPPAPLPPARPIAGWPRSAKAPGTGNATS
jgi:ectoine hydroxylase-related dioxygenase (phytanoyl-CoA dioxygenase family)